MTVIHDLPTPALLLDLDLLDANLQRMADKARTLGVALRPHFKTHKCVEVAERQRELGARSITVSTLYEGDVAARHGFDDITWAFPVILSRIDEAATLGDRVTLRLVVDSLTAVEALEDSQHKFHVWLKVDCGYHRAGVDPRSDLALEMAERLDRSPALMFDGILSHSGNAYAADSRAQLATIATEERDVMVEFAARLRDAGVEVPGISVGSTPAMSAAESLDGVTEVRPGNYVFYDATQVALGSCEVPDCAVTVLSSVISSQPGARHSVVDVGSLALSKDVGRGGRGHPTMGTIFEDYAAGAVNADVRLTSLSQEQGIVNAALPVGTKLRILPNHSCLTVACFDEYHVVQRDQVVGHWRIWRGR